MGEFAVDLLDYLSLLGPTRPFHIRIMHGNGLPELHPDELLREPTILACPRLSFYYLVRHRK